MNEAYLKTRLKKALLQAMPGAVVFSHTGAFHSGIPDLSCTWNGVTSWIEVKYSRGGRRSKATELQIQTLIELSKTGAPAFLLTYEEGFKGRIPPGAKNWDAKMAFLDRVISTDGAENVLSINKFDHDALAAKLRAIHEEA